MRRAAFWLSLTIPTLAVVWSAAWAEFPLGIPREWIWDRVEPSDSPALAVVPPVVFAILYVGFVWFGSSRIVKCCPGKCLAWLLGLSLSGFTWLWVVQESAPESYQLSKTAWVLYFRGSSGYYSEAREARGDLRGYLAGYKRKMGEGDVLHIGTHPPGLVILFHLLLDLCESVPELADAVIATEPDSVQMAFKTLQETSLRNQNPLPRSDRAALWLATLLVQAAAALTVVPLFGLLRQTATRRASWLASAFWPTIPALAVFIPKSDCLYPLIVTGFLWLWLTGRARPSWILCCLAGLVYWLGLLLSLAFLPVGLTALLAALGAAAYRPPDTGTGTSGSGEDAPHGGRLSLKYRLWTGLRSCLPSFVWMSLGFSLPTMAAGLILKLNLPAVWWQNFQNHAGFYHQFSRTYWKWLVINPLEFTIAAGLPLAVLAAWSIVRHWRLSGRRPPAHVGAWLATMLLLWLSGKNMGEAARLWVPFMPFLPWLSGPIFESSPAPAAATPRATVPPAPPADWDLLPGSAWIAPLALQLATTTAIVMRVVGFRYP